MGHPSGTVTFLFTDLEGSSRLWDEHPLQMRSALEQHDRLVAGAIEANAGYVFTTAGDSFAAAFQTADAAAQAAMDIQASIGDAPPVAEMPIRVRIGLHTGEAHERDGDYYGPAVNRAARIEASGHGGQTLLSEPTARILTVSTVKRWTLRELGEFSLKGLTRSERIFQLGDGDFGPLRVVHDSATNLTGQPPELIGRDQEVDRFVEQTATDRFITITGIGGVGKTSMARTIAHRLVADAAVSELWWCDLSAASPDSLAAVVGSAMGLDSDSHDAAGIAAALGRRSAACLVLDNCEHLVEPVRELVEGLLGSPVLIVATSRLPMGVAAERVFPLSPLSGDSAADLFIARSQRAGGLQGEPTEVQLSLIQGMCDRVDGIPLAIELLASRTRSLALADIDTRLEQILGVRSAVGGPAARHETMTAAIAWSIELLDPDVRAGLGELSIFTNGFDLDSAEMLLGGVVARDPLEAIDIYVAHSLIEMDRGPVGVRYRMLEPVRQYAADHLRRDPTATRHRHLEHFLDRLERAYEDLGTTGCQPYINFLAADMPDLEAAHHWAVESGRVDDDLRIYQPLAGAWIHDRHAVYSWAKHAVTISNIEGRDGWGAVVHCAAVASLGTTQQGNLEALLARYETVSSDDPSRELAAVVLANRQGLFSGLDWESALATINGPPPADTWARFSYYAFGPHGLIAAPPAFTGMDGAAAADAAVERLHDGLDWAASINALSLEVTLKQILGQLLVRVGRVDDAVDITRDAEPTSLELGMTNNLVYCSYHQVCAALLGAEVDFDPEQRTIEMLRQVARSESRAMASLILRVAARYLAERREFETAALCMLQPDFGFPDVVPLLAVNEIPDETWNSAQRASDGLDPIDLANSALQRLQDASVA